MMRAGLDALYVRRDPSAAVIEFRKVLARNPDHYGASFQLAVALDQAGKGAEARPLWERVLKMAQGYQDQATLTVARTRLAQKP
jgi:Flp pilus assembly protein TadD